VAVEVEQPGFELVALLAVKRLAPERVVRHVLTSGHWPLSHGGWKNQGVRE
jgi:hypothetical protein